MSPSRQWFQRRHHLLRLQHFGRLSPKLLLATGLLIELVQSLVCVILWSVCEEHIDDLSQFGTSSSRMQLLHDVAQIGKKGERRYSQVGPDLVVQIHSLGKRQNAGEADCESSGGRGGAHLPRDTCHTSRDRNRSEEKKMRIQSMETHVERKAKS